MTLTRRSRQALLVAHIVSAGAWIGIDVIVGVLVLTGWFGSGAELRSLAYRSLATFIVWPMLLSGLACLLTGVILGLRTRWGIFKYRWVTIKLVINVALCVLIVAVLRPDMPHVAAYGESLVTGDPDRAAVSHLFFPPAVSLTALSLACALAVIKPRSRGDGSRRSSIDHDSAAA